MRCVLQRVLRAQVAILSDVIGRIDRGLVVFVAAGHGDSDADAEWLADKIANLRIFADEAGLMNRSVAEVRGGLLLVSQFTLYGDCRRGRRPSFVEAMAPEPAEQLYDRFVARMRATGLQVETGRFRATMQIELVNEGPVTLFLDSRQR